jgi:RNA polymerase sigma factor (sigma-70 family)
LPDRQQLKHIIQGCVTANRQSQKEFYQLYYGFAMGICMRYCNTHDDSMEVVNDGFVKIFRTLPQFEPRHNNFEASLMGWMKSILINTAIDHFRKNKNNYLVGDLKEEHQEMTDTVANAIDRMSYKEVLELVQQLSPGYRAVFSLHIIDGFKHEEIAQRLNISVGTSKSNLAKARNNIQKMLKEANLKFYEQQKAV